MRSESPRDRALAMKYVDEYRDGALARSIARGIAREASPQRVYRLMEFCGGHTHAISRYGLEDLLPDNVRMIHGPGCPVCVLPMARIDMAIACARLPGVTLCAYGDLMRVPGSNGSNLLKAKAEGFTRFWTIVKAKIELGLAKQQSPTTTEFFNLDDIQSQAHSGHKRFKALLHQAVGIR